MELLCIKSNTVDNIIKVTKVAWLDLSNQDLSFENDFLVAVELD
jgi:hypothetical protein